MEVPKQHPIKVLNRKNGKVTQASLTVNGETKLLHIAKSGRVFIGNLEVGRIVRAKGRWFDNQFLISLNKTNEVEKQ